MEVGQAAGRSDKNTYIHSQTTSVLTASGMMCQLMRVHIKLMYISVAHSTLNW